MASAKLVFGPAADGNGRLVFGDQGAVVIPDADLSIDTDLPGLGELVALVGVNLSIDAELPGLDGEVALQWDANVSRVTRAALQTCWQQGQRLAGGLVSAWEQAQPKRSGAIARWQEARPLAAGTRAHWQESMRHRAQVRSHWQAAAGLRHALRSGWQETQRLRGASVVRWQEATGLRHALRSGWQEMQRLRAVLQTGWDDGLRLRASLGLGFGVAVPVRVRLQAVWQEAMRPRSGVSPDPALPPSKDPCYDPATVGRLVFSELADGGGRLVFVCNSGEVLPPAGVVVLPRRSYIMINSVEIRRADALAGDPLPCDAFSMQLDRQSWTWNFSASFHAAAGDAVAPGLNGEPVELEVRVNGVPYRMLGERFSPSRRLQENVVRVSGRGKAALLDDKNNPVRTFTSAVDRTASQLMTEALTINGVGFGWSVDFGLEDWLVTGGAWMHQGTYISALAEIAGAAGGYLQPHNTDAVIRVLPAWPKPWWAWGQLVPDIELPAGLSEIDDTDIVDRPLYNRIFVGGESYGVTADLTRTGTNGDLLKQPGVVHPLITGLDVAKQRARAELSVSGRSLVHKMTLPVLGQTGVIKPGVVLRYHDHANALRTGIVRSTNVSMQFPVLTQSLEVESHA